MPTGPQQTELEKAVTRTIYFAEFQFLAGTQYLSSWNGTKTWGGHDWIGLGGAGGVDPIVESDSLDAQGVSFTLNLAQASWLALAVGPVEQYRGLVAKLYFCPLDVNFNMVDTPEQCWRGTMDTMALGVDNDQGKIILRCETSAYGLKRRQNLRINAAQHKKRFPNDTGLDFLTNILSQPDIWLSKRFQGKYLVG